MIDDAGVGGYWSDHRLLEGPKIGLNWYEFWGVCNDGLLKGLGVLDAKIPMFHQECFWCVFAGQNVGQSMVKVDSVWWLMWCAALEAVVILRRVSVWRSPTGIGGVRLRLRPCGRGEARPFRLGL